MDLNRFPPQIKVVFICPSEEMGNITVWGSLQLILAPVSYIGLRKHQSTESKSALCLGVSIFNYGFPHSE